MPQKLVNIFVIGILLSFLATLLKASYSPEMRSFIMFSDYLQYRTGAYIFKTAPQYLYDLDYQKNIEKEMTSQNDLNGMLAYRCPPVVAAALGIITGFDLFSGYRIMLLANFIIFCLILFYLFRKPLGIKEVLLSLILISYLPVIAALSYGQISILIALIFLAVYKCLQEKKYFLAGAITALLFLKIQYLIITPLIFILADKRKFALGWSLSMIGNIIISTFLYGLNFLPVYIKFLLTSENSSAGSFVEENFNLASILNLFNLHSPTAHIGLTTTISFIFIFALWKQRKFISQETSFICAVLLAITLSLHTMPPDLVLLVIPFIIFYNKQSSRERNNILILLYVIPIIGLLHLQWLATLLLFGITVSLIIKDFAQKENPPIGTNPKNFFW